MASSWRSSQQFILSTALAVAPRHQGGYLVMNRSGVQFSSRALVLEGRVSVPMHVQVELEFEQLDCAVGHLLADHRDGTNQHSRFDQEAIVPTSCDERRKLFESCCELLDDLDEFDGLEIDRGRFAVRPSAARELSVQVFEECGRDPNNKPIAQLAGVDSSAAIRASANRRAFSTRCDGASASSRTTLAVEISSRSAGVIFSSSAAVQIFFPIDPI